MTQFRLNIHGQERAFEVTRQGERLHVRVAAAQDPLANSLPQGEGSGAAEVRVLHRDGTQLLIEIAWPDGTAQRVRLAGARQGDKRQLWIDGRTLTAERVRQRGGVAAAEGSLAAAIPAVVSQILVAPGDEVAAGDKLILLESMKMVIPIVAPRAGRVARVLCDVGESVPAGVPLVEMEEE
jgi:3-methylcrotonyl-CoA carboxylase alpha subunit